MRGLRPTGLAQIAVAAGEGWSPAPDVRPGSCPPSPRSVLSIRSVIVFRAPLSRLVEMPPPVARQTTTCRVRHNRSWPAGYSIWLHRKQSARVKRLRQPLSLARAPVMDCPPPAGILSRSRGASLIGGVQQSLDLVDRDRPLDDLRVRHLVCDRPGDVVDLGAFDAGGLERMRHIEAGNEGSHLVG